MSAIRKYILLCLTLLAAGAAVAQDSQSSAVMRRGGGDRQRGEAAADGTQVTERMRLGMETRPVSDADMEWMRVIYRQIDLTKDANTPLYFPDEPMEGQESLFRIIMRLLASGQLTAYDYLDGREVFTDKYKLNVRDMLDRFHVIYAPAKGSTEKNPKFEIDDSDVPATEVLTYYVIERWEFDRLSNRMRTRIEAICPVLHRSGDFGGEAVRYPMFWVKMDDLRPYLQTQNIFTSDDNNLATCTYADYFNLGLYEGDIYKTRNLRNQSLMQMHQDPDELKHAQDSIQNRLDTFEDKLWVPSLDELAKRREAKELAEAKAAKKKGKKGAEAVEPDDETENDEATVAEEEADNKPAVRSTRTKRGQASSDKKAKPAKVKRAKSPRQSSSSSAAKSVRNRRKGR